MLSPVITSLFVKTNTFSVKIVSAKSNLQPRKWSESFISQKWLWQRYFNEPISGYEYFVFQTEGKTEIVAS